MLKTRYWAAAAALSITMSLAAMAADATATGKWTWKVKRGDQEIMQTAELKQEGEKLTGHILGRNDMKLPISEGTIKAGELKFIVVRERNGEQIKIPYMGKLDGDMIEGKIGMGEREREWIATRVKP